MQQKKKSTHPEKKAQKALHQKNASHRKKAQKALTTIPVYSLFTGLKYIALTSTKLNYQ